jgi:peptide/nickel transport system permease protein
VSARAAIRRPSAAAPSRRALGALLLGLLLLFGLLGPELVAADPAHQDLSAALSPPGGAHLLGTDHLGRSVLARLAHATRLSLGIAAATVAAAAVAGTLLGLLAALRGGWTDRGLGLLATATQALPGLLLVLLVLAFAPGSVLAMALGIALAQWVDFFRVVRAQARGLLARPHAEAARVLGFGPGYAARRLLLPELAPVLGTLAAFGLGGAVAAVATLGFVNVGVRPPTAELGSMTVELLPYMAEAPAQALLPAAIVCAAVLGCQLLAGERRR